jgi:hypothetical protein
VTRTFLLVFLVALGTAACSSDSAEPAGHANPERAVVAWFEAIDAGDASGATASVHDGSLAVILSIENDLDEGTTAQYLDSGVPAAVQSAYWASFAQGFADFAAKPISSLTVGQSTTFTAEGNEFARVPISGGPSTDSVVFTRMQPDGSWEVDLIATLGDGFGTLLADTYQGLSTSEDAERIRAAYLEVVAPGVWAAITDGSYGDDFNRVGLALVGQIES